MAGASRIADPSAGRTFDGRSSRTYDVGPFRGVTMAEARRLHAAGALSAINGPSVSAKMHPRQGRHMTSPFVISIDMSEMRKVATGLNGIATEIERGHAVISQSINHGLRKLKTRTIADLRRWTGLRMRKPAEEAIKLHFASPSKLTGIMHVRSGHTVVTQEYYGASWSRSNPGATHAAWNRRQIAVSTFMIAGKKPVFRRLPGAKHTISRNGKRGAYPIAPIWGPNMAREVDRHREQVQVQVDAVGRIVNREAARLMRVAIAKAGG